MIDYGYIHSMVSKIVHNYFIHSLKEQKWIKYLLTTHRMIKKSFVATKDKDNLNMKSNIRC